MTSWIRRCLQKKPGPDPVQRIRVQSVRLRHLLRQYGFMIRLAHDAAEKQSGEYILDKQYVFALNDKAFETAERIVYDLNVLAGQRHCELYDRIAALHERVNSLMERELEGAAPAERENEEPEYRVLRRLRREVFGDDGTLHPDPAEDTLLGIVGTAQAAAVDSYAGLMRSLGSRSPVHAGFPIPAVILDPTRPDGAVSKGQPLLANSPPLSQFVTAFSTSEFHKDQSAAHPPLKTLVAVASEDTASVAFYHDEGFHLLDACLSCEPDSNYVYWRFSLGREEDGAMFPIAAGILERLGFSVARTRNAVSGWSASRQAEETAGKLRLIGKMAAYLNLIPALPDADIEKSVNRFFREQATD